MSILIHEMWTQSLPDLIQKLRLQSFDHINQADCLNRLRQLHIPFLNLGNIVLCPQQQILLIFKARDLYAYDWIQNLSNQ